MSSLQILADQNMRCVAEYFGTMGSVSLVDGRTISAEDLSGVDVLLVRSVTAVNESLLAGSQVRFVGTATSGFDHVDIQYLAERGIGFAHAPGSNANSVVEYVLAAIAHTDDKLERLLAGGSLGIIGYGNIGQALARRCSALGIAVNVYDPWLDADVLDCAASLSDVLGCEVISIHAELTHRQPWPSFHLLKEAQLTAVPGDTLMINAGRGELIDTGALLKLLKIGLGPRTVLDVWEGEPLISSELLEYVDIGTPHIAGYSLDGKNLATSMLRDALAQHLGSAAISGQQNKADAPMQAVPPGLRSAELIRWAVGARYNIVEDDIALRAKTLGSDSAAASQGFDDLRKHYRTRRELSGSTVAIEPEQKEQKTLLEALGCRVVAADL
ncbi:MAG: 4-phosphoerythronate dehydrogenase [Halioglobus sp.]